MSDEQIYSKVLTKQIVEDPTPPPEPEKPKKTGTAKKKSTTTKKKTERVPVMSASGKFVLYYKDADPAPKRERDASGRFVSSSQASKSAPSTPTKSTTSTTKTKSTTSVTPKKSTTPTKPTYPPCEPSSTLTPRVKANKRANRKEYFSGLKILPFIALAFLAYFFGAYLLLSYDFETPETMEYLYAHDLFDLRFDTYGYNQTFAFITPILFVGAINFSFGYLAFFTERFLPKKVVVLNSYRRNRTSMPQATIYQKTRPIVKYLRIIAFVAYFVALFLVLRSAYIDYFEPYFTESDTWIPFTQKNFITQKAPLTFVADAIFASIFCVAMNIVIKVKKWPAWVFLLCNFLLPLLTYFIIALIAIALFGLVVLGIFYWIKENF